MENSNHAHTYSSTASGAGLTYGIKWTAVRDQEVSTDKLVTHMVRLMKVGLVSSSHEMASCRRRFQHLIGQTGKDIHRLDIDGQKYWRYRSSDMEEVNMSLKLLLFNLQILRKEAWSLRVETRTRLSPYQYWSKVR